MTALELAEELRVSRKTIYRRARDGTFPGFRIGRKLLFRRVDIEAALAGMQARPGRLRL